MIGETNSILEINDKKPPYEQLVNYTMLYDYGDECSNITGGWRTSGLVTDNTGYTSKNAVFNTTNVLLALSNSNSICCGIKTKNSIVLTEYSKLFVKCYGSYGNNRTVQFTTSSTNSNYFSEGITASKSFVPSTTSEEYFENCSIKNVNSGYVSIWVTNSYSSYYSANIYVNNIFITKEDDWQTLANLAGITATSIEDILTNSTTLLSNKKAVEFMIYNCTGDFMASAIQSDTFLSALNNSKYATLIQANEHWAKFLAMVA